jgi:fucose permease
MRLLRLCLTIAFAGALIVLATHQPVLAALGVFLLGAGFSATFPVVLGIVGDRYTSLSGTAFSVAMVMGLAGGTTIPFATGLFGAAFGMRVSFVVVPAAIVLLSGLLSLATSQLARSAAQVLEY